MQNVNELTSLISTVGFPIVMCVFFGWYIIQRDKKEVDQSERHKQEIDNLSNIIQNNTLTMQKLIDKLDAICDMKKDK